MKNKISLAYLAIALLPLFNISCSDMLVDTNGTIYGRITDRDTGEPIKNVTVTLSPDSRNITTGSDGFYKFVNLKAPSQYEVQAQKEGYATEHKTVTTIPGGEVNIDLTMERI